MVKPASRSSKYICQCPDCKYRNWGLKGEYLAHLGRSPQPKYYACGWPYPDGRVCEKEFASPQNLAAHQCSVHGAKGCRFRCYFCEMSFNSAVKRTVHIRGHPEYLWQCLDCPLHYHGARDRNILITHIRKHHFGHGRQVSIEAVNALVVPPQITYAASAAAESQPFRLGTSTATGSSSSAFPSTTVGAVSSSPGRRPEFPEYLAPFEPSDSLDLSFTPSGSSSSSLASYLLTGQQEEVIAPPVGCCLMPSLPSGSYQDSTPLPAANASSSSSFLLSNLMGSPYSPGPSILHAESWVPHGVSFPPLHWQEVVRPLVDQNSATFWVPNSIQGHLPTPAVYNHPSAGGPLLEGLSQTGISTSNAGYPSCQVHVAAPLEGDFPISPGFNAELATLFGMSASNLACDPQQEPLAPTLPITLQPASANATFAQAPATASIDIAVRYPADSQVFLTAPLVFPGAQG